MKHPSHNHDVGAWRAMPLRTARPRLKAALILAWLLCWVSVTVASAQATFPPIEGGGIVADDTNRLDAGAINNAATDLQQRGVKPLAVLVQARIGANQISDFANNAAENYGLSSGGVLDPNLLAVVVSLGGRQATILYGDNLKGAMTQQRGGRTVVRILREDFLSPKLAGGDNTGAFADTFRQAAREIDLYKNPPTPVPPSVTTVDTEGIGDALIWIVGGLVILGALAVIGPALYKRWKEGQEAVARRRVLQDQLVQARNVTADMITNLELPVDPNEQITYRFLALALERERPQQLAEIRAQYDAVYDRVTAALARYEQTNSGTYTTEEEMTGAIAQYRGVQEEIKHASDFLQQLGEISKQVEGQISAAPGEVEGAKKALAAAADDINRLAAASPDLHPVDVLAALRPAQDKLTEAERALSSRPPLSLHALDSARESRAVAARVSTAIAALASAYNLLVGGREKLTAARTEGFKLAESDEQLAGALEALSAAAKTLEGGSAEEIGEALKQAEELARHAGESVEGALALHTMNAQALDRLKAEGEAVKQLIAQGAQAFDKVDEYAESTWTDIRGNGSEAQRAADDAYRLWGEATALNGVTPQSPQDFERAKAYIDEANRLLGNARTLITAIFDRLKHLEESKRVAAAEIEAAQSDIQAGRAFIRQFDPDISPSPNKLLVEAEGLLRGAQEEVRKPKPDWIKAVTLARKANDLADQALANARSEEEAMRVKRQKARTLQQQADTSLSRADNFSNVHRPDVDQQVFVVLRSAHIQMERGARMLALAESEGREDRARAQALEEAAQAFGKALEAADEAYKQAAAQFAAAEKARREAYNALQKADGTIRSAAAFIQEHQGLISQSAISALQAAIDSLPEWRDGADPKRLKAIKQAARKAENAAEEAYSVAQQEVQAYRDRQNAAQVSDLVGTLIAMGAATVLSNAGRRRDPGWGGGIFGGSGDGGWGGSGGGISIGGGSDSGGWGGGGSDSGGWGGGGSDSGSWGGGGSDSGGW